MPMNAASPEGGLFASLRGLLETAVGLLQTRFELLATELEEEKLRLISLLAFGAAAFFLLGVGVVLLVIFLALLWWDSHRLLVIGGFTALFLGCGSGALLLALRQIRTGTRLFAASLAELRQDREALQEKPGENP